MNLTHPAQRGLVAMTDQTVVTSSQAAGPSQPELCDL